MVAVRLVVTLFVVLHKLYYLLHLVFGVLRGKLLLGNEVEALLSLVVLSWITFKFNHGELLLLN